MSVDEDEIKYIINIVTVGDTSVGKSSICKQYNDQTFDDNIIPTIGADFKTKIVDIGEHTINVKFWDTAGQEKYRALGKKFYQQANGILMVYDVTDKNTFENLDYWKNEILQHSKNDLEIMVVGNKVDLIPERQVSEENGKQYAKDNGYFFFETSAKDNINVQEAMTVLIKETAKKVIKAQQQIDQKDMNQARNSIQRLDLTKINKKKGCC